MVMVLLHKWNNNSSVSCSIRYLYSRPVQTQHGWRRQVCPASVPSPFTQRDIDYAHWSTQKFPCHYRREQWRRRWKHRRCDERHPESLSWRSSIFGDIFWVLMTHVAMAEVTLPPFCQGLCHPERRTGWDGWMNAGTCAGLRYSCRLSGIRLSFQVDPLWQETYSFDANSGFLPYRWMCRKMGPSYK